MPPFADRKSQNRPLHLAFIMHVMQVAGAEVLVAETIRRLGSKITPVIYCLDSIGALGEQLQREGIEVISFDRKPGRDFGLAWRMARDIRRRRIQVLHAHQYTPFFYAALANALAGRPARVIFTEHGRHYPDIVSSLRRGLNRLVFNQLADEINAVCHFSARSLCIVDGFAGHRIRVIENGIDLSRYERHRDRKDLKKRLGLDPAQRYLITVARFHPVKDHETLLRAFAKVADTVSDVDLLLAGDGPLRESLQQLTSQLKIADRVHFLGVRGDVPDLLQAADIFVMTSLSEAASLTILEAMASQLPVVVTEVGGNPEMVRAGVDGLLVPRGDSEKTAEAILELLEDEDLIEAMGRAGRQHVEQRYDLNQTIANYFNLYRELAPMAR